MMRTASARPPPASLPLRVRRRLPLVLVIGVGVLLFVYLASAWFRVMMLERMQEMDAIDRPMVRSVKPIFDWHQPQKADEHEDSKAHPEHKQHQQQQQQQTHTQQPQSSEEGDVITVEVNEEALDDKLRSFEPRTAVAWAIPVGGRTRRSVQLDSILSNLINGGAPPKNIFVMEDVEGRPGGKGFEDVAEVVRKRGVHLVSSHVSRADMPENKSNFGIHLARHYKFMLDYLLVSPEAAGARGDDLIKKGEQPSTGSAAAAGPPFDFAVIIEDDLVLAPDFVKYFLSMSRVMEVDDTLYCVSAHQDNAFYGTSWTPDNPREIKQLDELGFDFRRGNHFMAPGWMTSRHIYTTVVRDRWLDSRGEYSHKQELHLRNGHWDRFFDSLVGSRDCIFPEIPRIIHQGADGFTVSQKAQMELYSNLRLANLDPSVTEYGDLSRLTKAGYIASEIEFIRQAAWLNSPDEIRHFRHSKIVLTVPALDDKDEAWNAVLNGFFGVLGVGGYGGWEGYVKVRGIFMGSVLLRWITNQVMLVGMYSPYMKEIRKKKPAITLDLTYEGCFQDDGKDRDLPFMVRWYKPSIVTGRSCASSCAHAGYKYAAVQAAMECWCGDKFGKHGEAKKSWNSVVGGDACSATRCKADRFATEEEKADADRAPLKCGGGWANAVYAINGIKSIDVGSNTPQPLSTQVSSLFLVEQVLQPPQDALYILADENQSCEAACSNAPPTRPDTTLTCNEALFPLIHRHCRLLQSMVGCSTCVEEEDIMRGMSTPGGWGKGGNCLLSRGRYIRCAAKPHESMQGFRRACVCEVKATK